MDSVSYFVKSPTIAATKHRSFWTVLLCYLVLCGSILDAQEIEIHERLNQHPMYQGVELLPIEAPGVSIVADGSVEVNWYYGEPPVEFNHGDPVPDGNVLLRSETLDEPTIVEEDRKFYDFDLVGIVLEGIHPIWVSVKTPDHEATFELRSTVSEGEAPPRQTGPVIEKGWAEDWPVDRSGEETKPDHYIEWNKIAPGYIRGTDFSDGYYHPYLNVRAPGDWKISFYRGEVGDTSDLIYSAEDGLWSPMGGSYVFFNNYIQEDTVQVWARVESDDDFIMDSSPVMLRTIEPEEIELSFWPDAVKDADAGSQVILRPEFSNYVSGAMLAKLYWGETGDTSDLILSIDAFSVPELKVTVPEEPRNVWARIQYGNLVIDTPPTLISPLPLTAPKIVDQPSDIFRGLQFRGTMSIGQPIGAIGGNLNFLWYEGEIGDLSTMLPAKFSPITKGNIRYMDVEIPDDAEHVYILVWNELGTIASRKIAIRQTIFNDLILSNYPIITRLTQKDLYQRETAGGYFDFFWAQGWVMDAYSRLMKKVDGEFVDVNTSYGLGGGGPGRASYLIFYGNDSHSTLAVSLPSGTYKYRFFFDEDYMDSHPFTFINEVLDGTTLEVPAAAYPVVPAGQFTNGGVFTATIRVTQFIEWESQRVYAGAIGDRSNPVEFESSHSRRYHDIYTGEDFGDYQFSIEWPATGDAMYWFEAKTHAGKVVRTVLRYPDQGNDSSENNGHVTNILIPPGSDVIPIPNLETLPNVTDWRIGDGDETGTKISLPFQLSDMTRPGYGLTLWDENGEPIELMDIHVGGDIPPQILQTSDKVAVVPGGRVIWTSYVNGDVTLTEAFAATDEDDWQLVKTSPMKFTDGFVVPDDATQFKTVYHMDTLSSEASYGISRIPEEFIINAEVASTWQDTFITERMGTFLEASQYPFLRHAELGWMLVHPYEGGLVFLGDTSPNATDWNWTHPEYFPAIYNFRTQSWKYYWINGYGWFYDYASGNWESVAN
ncbi:MAG: hypothetical protein AB3N63_16515 [Puniceicoccaceae bacterium]